MKLYVGGLSFKTNDQELNEYFSQIGEVESAIIIKDKFDNSRSRGFGFVEFKNDDDAKKAMSEFNDKDFMGRKLMISEAHDKKPGDRNDRNDRGGNSGSFRRRSF